MNAAPKSTAVAVAKPASSIPALAMREDELIGVLKSSLYPGAEDESIKLVVNYCKAAGLDPMQKPVHIVPMTVKVGKDQKGKDIYAKRDVIMPGVGLYRVQAARTGEYVGMSEPEFGPDHVLKYKKKIDRWIDGPHGREKTSSIVDAEIQYPEWVKVTVFRLVAGEARAFTAIEFWLENYATASNDTTAPNSMWERRPRGQIVKCVEAQALRKAFPEIGAQPTAEEAEGHDLAAGAIDGISSRVEDPPAYAGPQAKAPAAKPAAAKAAPEAGTEPGDTEGPTGSGEAASAPQSRPENPFSAGPTASASQIRIIRAKLDALSAGAEDPVAERATLEANLVGEIGGANSLDEISVDQGNVALRLLKEWADANK